MRSSSISPFALGSRPNCPLILERKASALQGNLCCPGRNIFKPMNLGSGDSTKIQFLLFMQQFIVWRQDCSLLCWERKKKKSSLSMIWWVVQARPVTWLDNATTLRLIKKPEKVFSNLYKRKKNNKTKQRRIRRESKAMRWPRALENVVKRIPYFTSEIICFLYCARNPIFLLSDTEYSFMPWQCHLYIFWCQIFYRA